MNYETRTDEELLLSSRMGDVEAESMLNQRYFNARRAAAKSALPDAMHQLDDWAINEAHFHAYLNAVSTYQFRGVKFFTYYMGLLRRELMYSCVIAMRDKRNVAYIDFSSPASPCSADGYTFADTTPTDEPMDDPHAFFQYAETLAALDRLPKGIEPETLKLVCLVSSGYSVSDAAKSCGVTRESAKYRLKRYRKWALSTIQKLGGDESDLKEKEKLLDRFLRSDEE